MTNDLLVALILFAVAFAYANVGLGGGLLYFPVLGHFYAGWTPSTVVALTLLFSIATLSGSAYGHGRRGLIRFRYAFALAVPMALGSILGARITLGLDMSTAKAIFSGALLAIAAKMGRDLLRSRAGGDASRPGVPARGRPERGDGPGTDLRERMPVGRLIPVVGIAACGGVVSGSLGIGGGVFAVPLLIYAARLETRPAVGTASVALMITASVGLGTFYLSRGIHAPAGLAFALCAATLAGGTLGSRFGLRRLRARDVRALFIGLLVLAAVWNVWAVWGGG